MYPSSGLNRLTGKYTELQKLKNIVIKYNKETDSVYIRLSEGKVAESDEDKKDIILDYDDSGNIIGIEILNASKKTDLPNVVTYEVA